MKPKEDASIVAWAHRFMIAFGIFWFSVGLHLGIEAYKHVSSALVVDGEVVSLGKGASAGHAIVHYVGPQGHEHELRSSVRSDPPRHFVGEKVGVLINPNDPGFTDSAVIDSFAELWGGPLFLMGFGAFFVFLTLGVGYLINLDLSDERRESYLVNRGTNLFLIIGLVCIALGLKGWSDTNRFVAKAVRVDGTVVSMRSYVPDAVVQYPVVRYTDHKGHQRLLYSTSGSSAPSYEVGDKVKVLFDRDSPDYPTTAKIDSFGPLWGWIVLLSVIGVGFVSITLAFKYSLRKSNIRTRKTGRRA